MVNPFSSTEQMAKISLQKLKSFRNFFLKRATEQSVMFKLLEGTVSGLTVAHPGTSSSPLPILCLWGTRSTSVTGRADPFKQHIDTSYKNNHTGLVSEV